ncbi:MAG: metal-sulfur cluster assembly factor [Caldilineaceae bacterium]
MTTTPPATPAPTPPPTPTAADYREALKAVIDPEIYQNIIDLGMVYGVEVAEENRVTVTMTLTTPHCPMGPQIIQNVEEVLLAKGAAGVDVNLVWQPAWTPDAMTDELKRLMGILPDEAEAEAARTLELPPPPKKKSWLRRLFGG